MGTPTRGHRIAAQANRLANQRLDDAGLQRSRAERAASRTCFLPGIVAADEAQQAIDSATKRDDVDASRIVAVGMSYGTRRSSRSRPATRRASRRSSISPAAAAATCANGRAIRASGTGRRRVRGLRRDDPRAVALAVCAERPAVGQQIPKEWFARCRQGHPPARFVETEPVGDDGHALMIAGQAPWRPIVADFLAHPGDVETSR